MWLHTLPISFLVFAFSFFIHHGPAQAAKTRDPAFIQVQTGHTSEIKCLHLNDDGRILISTDTNSVISLWDVSSRRLLAVLASPERASYVLITSLSELGKYLFVSYFDYTDDIHPKQFHAIWDTGTRLYTNIDKFLESRDNPASHGILIG